MASSAATHCFLKPSKAPAPSNQLQNRRPRTHQKSSKRIHAGAASAACIPSAAAAAAVASSSPSSSLFKCVVSHGPPDLSYFGLERPHLGPEFRRARTTKVISKRNTSSSRPFHDNSRTVSPAARRVLALIVQSGADDAAVGLSDAIRGSQRGLCVPEDYCSILHELGDFHRCPSKAVAFFDLSMGFMRTHTEKGKLLSAAISALGKMGRHDLAKRLFDSGIAGGYGSTVFAYSAQISAYARNGLFPEAIALFEAMKARGLRPNNVSYNAVIDACGKGGADPAVGLELFGEMLRNGLRPDRKTFNSLISGCSRVGHLDHARLLFDEMVLSGVGHDLYTYNTFVDAVCKSGNMDMAVHVVRDMPANGVPPNVVTYSTLMDGYSKLDRFDEALMLYEEMRSLGIQLDRVCYNTLLSIYVKTSRYDDIVRVCEEMDLLGIEKDAVTYNSLLHGYGKLGRLDVVSYLIRDMKRNLVSPTVLTYSTLIDIYSKAGMYVEAADVFFEFKESGLKADVVLYSSLIDTLSKNGMVEHAMWLLDEMTRMGIKPNVVSYNAVIDAFGKSLNLVQESGISQSIVKVFDRLDIGNGVPATEGDGRPGELFRILELFKKMNQQGVRPNVVTFSAILNACSRCDSFEGVSSLLMQLRLFDNSVYGVAHGLLVGGCMEVWKKAQTLFDELKHMDRQTSSAFYNALTDMLWYYGQRLGAQKVVLEGVQRQAWENTWNEFSLDLHLMSSGAAQAMVHAWLLKIRSVVFTGRKLPEFVSILTGWGKHSKVAGTLCYVIRALLLAIGAPFRVERFNIGRFVSPGAVVTDWLRESDTIDVLLLYDERPGPDSPSVDPLLPGLQALQSQ